MLDMLTRELTLQMTPSGMAFLAAVSEAEMFIGDNRVTIFAPTNEAFTAAAQKFGGVLPEAAVADVCLLPLLTFVVTHQPTTHSTKITSCHPVHNLIPCDRCSIFQTEHLPGQGAALMDG